MRTAMLIALLTGVCFAQLGGQGGQAGMGGGGGFGGPAVLGRGIGSGTGQRGGGDVGLRFYAGVTATFDTGLSGFVLDPNGALTDQSTKGVDAV